MSRLHRIAIAQAILAVAASMTLCNAQSSYVTPNAPLLGSAWYPEQWPESTWESDLALMEQAHMDVVRIGEFAWSSEEPAEGVYTLDWIDRAIALAAKHHIAVVIGTPTDAPPAWLTSKYPETLGMNADGKLREHGNRRQFNYANPHYRQLCASIDIKLAERYGQNPNVIGWQIGNEYTDESFDPETRTQFQQFLKAKYETLENLNAHWSTSYWSQSYTRWEEIPMEATNGNPGLLLEHKHFVTATWRSFQKSQIDVLRPRILRSQFITTNIGGLAWSDNWDHYAMTEDLDLASWDDYVGQGHLYVAKNAMLNDFVRGWKRANFWVMETQPGSVNWAGVNNALAPGETRALAWQTIGHGADAVLYWQWRSALNGQEQYHGAIVGPDGQPLPIYYEIQQLGRDLELTRAALAGTQPHADIAILHDYDSRWAIDFQPHTKLYDQQQVLLRFYEPLAKSQSLDIVDPTSSVDLTQYKLLVAPSLNVIDEALAAKLLAYVEQGGYLLLGPRSGMKDQYDALNPQRQPGPLAATLGAKVDQYYALDHSLKIDADSSLDSSADTWAEALTTVSVDTRKDLFYTDPGGWLDHQAAMVSRSVGKGTIAYLGTLPDSRAMDILLARIVTQAGSLHQVHPHDAEIEIDVRTQGGRSTVVVINHGATVAEAHLRGSFHNLLPGNASQSIVLAGIASTSITLPPEGIAVFIPEVQK